MTKPVQRGHLRDDVGGVGCSTRNLTTAMDSRGLCCAVRLVVSTLSSRGHEKMKPQRDKARCDGLTPNLQER